MKINPNQLADIITEKVLEKLSSKIRLLIREEIILNEELKSKNITQKHIVEKQTRQSKLTIQQKKDKIITEKKKILTGTPEIDDILNQDILLEDSLEEELYNNQRTNFREAALIRNNNENQKKKNNNGEFTPEEVEMINKMVDRMTETAKEMKKDTTKVYSEFGNVKSLYNPKEIEKLKLPT